MFGLGICSFACESTALISFSRMFCRVRSTPAILHRSSLASVLWSKRHQLPSRCVPHMAASSSAITRAEYFPPVAAWMILRMQSAT